MSVKHLKGLFCLRAKLFCYILKGMSVILIRGSYLRAKMMERGIASQRELAEKADLHPVLVSRLLKAADTGARNPPLNTSTLDSLCGALDCKPGDLLDFSRDDLNANRNPDQAIKEARQLDVQRQTQDIVVRTYEIHQSDVKKQG